MRSWCSARALNKVTQSHISVLGCHTNREIAVILVSTAVAACASTGVPTDRAAVALVLLPGCCCLPLFLPTCLPFDIPIPIMHPQPHPHAPTSVVSPTFQQGQAVSATATTIATTAMTAAVAQPARTCCALTRPPAWSRARLPAAITASAGAAPGTAPACAGVMLPAQQQATAA